MDMDELLAGLFASGFLTEESKTAVKVKLEEALEAYKTEVKVELAKRVIEGQSKLAEEVDAKVTTLIAAEIKDLHEDIAKFRDLEAEYALKLVEAKEAMKLQQAEERESLAKKLDTFIQDVLTKEFDELREDIAEMRKANFGLEMFESFAPIFRKKFYDESADIAALNLAESKVKSLEEKVKIFESKANADKREAEMARVLAPLSGTKREQMAILLASTPTEKLTESYSKYIGAVLNSKQSLNEDTKTNKPATKVVTGNVDKTPGVKESIEDTELANMLRIAGINK